MKSKAVYTRHWSSLASAISEVDYQLYHLELLSNDRRPYEAISMLRRIRRHLSMEILREWRAAGNDGWFAN